MSQRGNVTLTNCSIFQTGKCILRSC